MPRCGTAIFTDPDDYQSGIRAVKFNFTFNHQKDFKARLTWVELRHVRLLRGQENLPRVAHISLTSDSVFIALPAFHGPLTICDGADVQPGEMVFHSQGQRLHQRTRGRSNWGFISLAPEHLAACSRALTGVDLMPPPVARIVRPPRRDAAHLLRLHTEACRLAETNSAIIAHQEVSRALEQELLHVLVNCLMRKDLHRYNATNRRHADVIERFENLLETHLEHHLPMSKLCKTIGVPERTFRMCCAKFLGMSPNRYLRQRRLNMVHAILRHAEQPPASVEEVARRYGFSELGRFAAIYRTVFGELPSTTLQRTSLIRDAKFAEFA
jgi:AraC-like DNA-binding protein